MAVVFALLIGALGAWYLFPDVSSTLGLPVPSDLSFLEGGSLEGLSDAFGSDEELAPGEFDMDESPFLLTGIRNGDPEIYLARNREDTVWTRLTDSPGLDNGASWSPDGRSVVFHSERDSEAGSRELDVYRIQLNPLGRREGPPERLTDAPGNDYLASFSPDGRYIAFLSRRPEPAFPTGSPGQIWIMEADGSNPRQVTLAPITASLGPTWHPDGQSIFVSRRMVERGPTALTRVWLDFNAPEGEVLGGREAVVVADTFFNYTPYVSPDGQQMAYTAETGEHARVMITDLSGTDPQPLTDAGYTYVDGWTPDGRWIVVTRWYPSFQRREAWLVSPDTAVSWQPILSDAQRSASGLEFRPVRR